MDCRYFHDLDCVAASAVLLLHETPGLLHSEKRAQSSQSLGMAALSAVHIRLEAVVDRSCGRTSCGGVCDAALKAFRAKDVRRFDRTSLGSGHSTRRNPYTRPDALSRSLRLSNGNGEDF